MPDRYKPTHKVHPEFQARKILVSLIGCGGSGSQLLTELGRIHVALRGTGHPGGLHVVACDPDRVTEANRGRQMFAAGDVGQFKAAVLIHRVNAFFGVSWEARTEKVETSLLHPWQAPYGALPAHIVITCVDTPKARMDIHRMATAGRIRPVARYWLDLGNGADFGQVVLGEAPGWKWTSEGKAERIRNQIGDPPEFIERAKDPRGWHVQNSDRLPTITDLVPNLEQMPVDDTPSCSLAEALHRQNLFVNRQVVTWAGTMLWSLLFDGRLDYHAVWVNLRTGEAVSRACEPVRLQPWETTTSRAGKEHARASSRCRTLYKSGESSQRREDMRCAGRNVRTTRPV